MTSSVHEDTVTSTAADTIELLEARLRRLEYLLTGNSSWSGEAVRVSSTRTPQKDSVTSRLAVLEHDLKGLSAKVPAVRDVLRLYSLFPDLFQSPSSPSAVPTTLSPQALAAIVLSYASAFPETASRLTSLKDLPIPPASASASLIELRPRLERLAAVQAEQAAEISKLRARSALLIKRWMEVGILGGGEVWAEWEARVEEVEKGVRRLEAAKERGREA
ncbi:hypothetical protein VTO42DRAFT_5575 [Malbranchea cinnamomea]